MNHSQMKELMEQQNQKIDCFVVRGRVVTPSWRDNATRLPQGGVGLLQPYLAGKGLSIPESIK
jgi:hypothetical protein